jgi:hypothetical protein
MGRFYRIFAEIEKGAYELTHKSWTPNPTQKGQSHVQIQQRVQTRSYSALPLR